MACKEYITRLGGDECVGLSCGAVKKSVIFFNGVFGWGGLLHDKGTKGREHHHVDGADLIKEDANDFLKKNRSALLRRGSCLRAPCITPFVHSLA